MRFSPFVCVQEQQHQRPGELCGDGHLHQPHDAAATSHVPVPALLLLPLPQQQRCQPFSGWQHWHRGRQQLWQHQQCQWWWTRRFHGSWIYGRVWICTPPIPSRVIQVGQAPCHHAWLCLPVQQWFRWQLVSQFGKLEGVDCGAVVDALCIGVIIWRLGRAGRWKR